MTTEDIRAQANAATPITQMGTTMQRVSREPQTIDKSSWYYEFPSHLLIVHECRDKDGNFIQTDQFRLPWRLIERSRRRKPKARRKI